MISKNSLKVVRNTPNLRELTTEALRNAILSMHFKPKQRLVERTLCEQTGVSRTCVREALQHLESEGLVNRVANKGLFVASVTADEARQIYEVRASLESSAGQMFVIRASKNRSNQYSNCRFRNNSVQTEHSIFARLHTGVPSS